MIHWLTSFVIPKIEYTAISTLTGAAVIGCIIAPFKRFWGKVWRAVDSLDPDTDTGVTKQLKQLQAQEHVPVVPPHRK